MRTKTLGALVSLALIAAACGGEGGSEDVREDDPILQIVSEGGFLPIEVALNNGPRFTLLGDGRLIHQGIQTLEYPGRLVPPYMVATLEDEQMNVVLGKVNDIGLPEIDEELDQSAANFVADASTDVVTFWDDNGEHRYGVYALGIQDSPSERNAAFVELIQTLDEFVGQADAEPHVAERVRVITGEAFVDPEFEDVQPWPLEGSDPAEWKALANGWACTAIDGPVPDVFDSATQATTWEHPDGNSDPVQLLVRPLHPGEPDCPS
jgi:hypothetical protein